MKTGVFYGSSSGTTEDIAGRIAAALGVTDVCNVAAATPEMIAGYDLLVLGTSTWGVGELQDDWNDALKVFSGNLSGKTVALFGCGDSSSFGSSFCDGIGILYEEFKGEGCRFIGAVATDGYTYDASTAVVDGKFVGLPVDEVNEASLTDARISDWVAQLRTEML